MSIESAMREHEDELMRLPNVTGVGIGKKAGRDVIKVFVTRKVPETCLRPGDIVPKSLAGFEIDVDEIGLVNAEGSDG